jgi:hypothetical protein
MPLIPMDAFSRLDFKRDWEPVLRNPESHCPIKCVHTLGFILERGKACVGFSMAVNHKTKLYTLEYLDLSMT